MSKSNIDFISVSWDFISISSLILVLPPPPSLMLSKMSWEKAWGHSSSCVQMSVSSASKTKKNKVFDAHKEKPAGQVLPHNTLPGLDSSMHHNNILHAQTQHDSCANADLRNYSTIWWRKQTIKIKSNFSLVEIIICSVRISITSQPNYNIMQI